MKRLLLLLIATITLIVRPPGNSYGAEKSCSKISIEKFTYLNNQNEIEAVQFYKNKKLADFYFKRKESLPETKRKKCSFLFKKSEITELIEILEKSETTFQMQHNRDITNYLISRNYHIRYSDFLEVIALGYVKKVIIYKDLGLADVFENDGNIASVVLMPDDNLLNRLSKANINVQIKNKI